MKSLHTLLAGAIDYAGLFPPASLDMDSAVRNYAAYTGGEHAWALGRFIVPAGRLPEFEGSLAQFGRQTPGRWRVSALLGSNLNEDVAAIDRFNGNSGPHDDTTACVDMVEARASTVDEIRHLAHVVPRSHIMCVEIPLEPDPAPLLAAIGMAGVRAKVRTGGVTADSFPSVTNLAGFIDTCSRKKVPFKATAGLHHPLRGQYRLTYEPGSSQGTMYGFLNVFVAAAVAFDGGKMSEIIDVLEEHPAFIFGDDEFSWHNHHVGLSMITSVRNELALSFGSCSFTEPFDDLTSLGLL